MSLFSIQFELDKSDNNNKKNTLTIFCGKY